jgi:hypothetical protein
VQCTMFVFNSGFNIFNFILHIEVVLNLITYEGGFPNTKGMY